MTIVVCEINLNVVVFLQLRFANVFFYIEIKIKNLFRGDI